MHRIFIEFTLLATFWSIYSVEPNRNAANLDRVSVNYVGFTAQRGGGRKIGQFGSSKADRQRNAQLERYQRRPPACSVLRNCLIEAHALTPRCKIGRL